MTNIAGKSYAINVISPLPWYNAWVLKAVFFLFRTPILGGRLKGLTTLSLIHYARWVVLRAKDFPSLDPAQPKEQLNYNYEFFFSNFNGSWEQYIDSFSSSIPTGLDWLWRGNIRYPKSVPFTPFKKYITYNQYWTSHYYNAYPMASTNDVKSAEHVRTSLVDFESEFQNLSTDVFESRYNQLVLTLQDDLSTVAPTRVVSLAAQAIEDRKQRDASRTYR